MNITRCMCIRNNLKPTNALSLYKNNCLPRCTSTKSSEISKKVKDPSEEEVYDIRPRAQNRRAAFAPIIKNVFLGRGQNEALEFLEVLDNDDIYVLNKRVEAIDNVITDKNLTDADVFSNLKKWRIVGAPAPVFHGGLEAKVSERLRILESLSSNVAIAKQVRDHWMGIYCLLEDNIPSKDRDELLPKLTDGSAKIRICLNEKLSETPDQADLRSEASYNGVGGWTITGEKLIDKLDVDRDTYLVVVCPENRSRTMQSFFVEPGAKGVEYTKNCVIFNDTPARLLGDDDDLASSTQESKSSKIIQNVLTNFRLDTAAIYLGSLSDLIKKAVTHIKGTYISGRPRSSVPLIQDAITSANIYHYRAASALYMTAGLADGLVSPDIDLEAAACRDLCLRAYTQSLSDLTDTFDVNLGKKKANDLEEMMGEGSGPLRVYLGLVGLQYAGHAMAVEIKKIRNPLINPVHALKKAFGSKDPNLTLRLKDNLHHTLTPAADLLEICILKMFSATEIVLMRHGTNVLTAHRDVNRLSLAATEIYSMFAVLSRASRAYCIGLHNAERDVMVAIRICYVGHATVLNLINSLDDGAELSYNLASSSIAMDSVKCGGNFSEHPLKRSFC